MRLPCSAPTKQRSLHEHHGKQTIVNNLPRCATAKAARGRGDLPYAQPASVET
jgi:hypothetical protein